MSGDVTGKLQAFIDHPLVFCTIHARITAGKIVIIGISLKRPKSGTRQYFSDGRLDAVVQVFRSILNGTGKSANSCMLDLSWCTPFQEHVLTAARKIPKGATVTYAELAARAGYPNAVRAAASVMRYNRFPLIIPCHRVIRSDGTTGGFMGKKRGWAIELKRSLLESEKKPRTAAHCCR